MGNKIYIMIIEQTKKYQKRIVYNPKTNTFCESKYDSLFYARSLIYPYGWIKESGTPPQPHWDVILISNDDYELGDEVEINVIGVFIRNVGDHKYVAVTSKSKILDLFSLPKIEIDNLKRLYPKIDNGEGWFGHEMAEKCMIECVKSQL